ncbi:hypothetical protein [Gymnodinialimonas ceratoperidinii]|uniref:GIY-YIG domain-containing protein n=1 Tax=Gymnodinialimonas ceratoperidinii TaxID=2856823 RepID=A0A8F6YCP8_9RHOB|nr:hypothetical protein [Gymnodinialimonas ceratoperidinii]QXT39427.1 hypothetical protein KYE46_16120 [Gymnodinialimonas ceratoperidinii]
MELIISEPIKWESRKDLPKLPGVYIIARGDPQNTVYIGRTWGGGGLRNRIRTFHRSATTGLKGHAGGVTHHRLFGLGSEPDWVSFHTPANIKDAVRLYTYIAYVERYLIWRHVDASGALPVCNSE